MYADFRTSFHTHNCIGVYLYSSVVNLTFLEENIHFTRIED
jgi:hypothetical protein